MDKNIDYIVLPDGTIDFKNLDRWSNTDPDCGQFRFQHDPHTFTFVQVKEESPFFEVCGHQAKHFLKKNMGKLKMSDFYIGTINLKHYTTEEQREAVEPYGDILMGSKGVVRNQLIAECIFEQECTCTF